MRSVWIYLEFATKRRKRRRRRRTVARICSPKDPTLWRGRKGDTIGIETCINGQCIESRINNIRAPIVVNVYEQRLIKGW